VLKRPRIGQIVATIAKCDCYAGRFDDGEKVKIVEIDSLKKDPRGIFVRNLKGYSRWHCNKCLRLLTSAERKEVND